MKFLRLNSNTKQKLLVLVPKKKATSHDGNRIRIFKLGSLEHILGQHIPLNRLPLKICGQMFKGSFILFDHSDQMALLIKLISQCRPHRAAANYNNSHQASSLFHLIRDIRNHNPGFEQ